MSTRAAPTPGISKPISLAAVQAHLPKYPKPPTFPIRDPESSPLKEEFKEDGKSLVNPPRVDGGLSGWYDKVWDGQPGAEGKSWWDFVCPSRPFSFGI